MNTPENINTNTEPYVLPLEGLPEPEHTTDNVAAQHPVQGVLPFKVPGAITAISPESAEQAKRGWKVKLNGAEVSDVSEVDIENDKLGLKLRYGKTETGYDSIQFTEGGGPVTIPYMRTPDGQLWIGVVSEVRDNMGGEVFNVPRGMIEKHESMEDAAKRELVEETGHDIYDEIESSMTLLASGINSNSAITNTSQSKKHGATFYGVELKPSQLELTSDEDGNVYYVFPKHIREQAVGDKTGERILGSRFIPVDEAVESKDMYTAAGAGYVMNALRKREMPGLSKESRRQIIEFAQRPDRALR